MQSTIQSKETPEIASLILNTVTQFGKHFLTNLFSLQTHIRYLQTRGTQRHLGTSVHVLFFDGEFIVKQVRGLLPTESAKASLVS